jgi:hypothetical protein
VCLSACVWIPPSLLCHIAAHTHTQPSAVMTCKCNASGMRCWSQSPQASNFGCPTPSQSGGLPGECAVCVYVNGCVSYLRTHTHTHTHQHIFLYTRSSGNPDVNAFPYLVGDVFYPVFGPRTTTECRLILVRAFIDVYACTVYAYIYACIHACV